MAGIYHKKYNYMKTTNKLFPKLLAVSVLSLSSMMAMAHNDGDSQLAISTNITPSQMNTNSVSISEDKKVLMAKLAKLNFFSAKFTQKIFSESGQLLQQGAGNLAISKPNLVNWKTTEPDETFIISDGETLWFYDPFIEQATAYNLAQSIHNTPILLLTSNDETLWQQYLVKQSSDNFVITPLKDNSQIKSLTVTFSSKSFSSKGSSSKDAEDKMQQEHLSEFSFVDATGQISTIILADFDAETKPSESLFDFNLPQGVRLEDKR